MTSAHLIEGPAIAEDEVDRAFDEAILKVVTTCVIEQRVLCAIESTIVERGLVAANHQGHSLFAQLPRLRHRSNVLHSCPSP